MLKNIGQPLKKRYKTFMNEQWERGTTHKKLG